MEDGHQEKHQKGQSIATAGADNQNHTYRATELEHHANEEPRRRPSCRDGICDKRAGLCEDGHQEKRWSGGPLTESELDQRLQPDDWH